MPVTRHPPHSSRRAARPHRAPASGDDAQAPAGAYRTYTAGLMCQETPARWPTPGGLRHVALGPLPALHLRRRSPGTPLVRQLRRDSAAVRLPAPVQHGRAPRVHRADLVRPPQARGRASRGPPKVFSRLPEVSDPARCGDALPSRRPRGCLPRVRSASAPRRSPRAGLHTLPARSPVNASRLPLPIVTPDSEPVWVAHPSLPGTFTLHHAAGFSRR
jgi:hypothetical protein